MLSGLGQAAAMQVAQSLRPRWSSRIAQCDPPVQCDDWMFALFCPNCAAAAAKSKADGTNPCYNILCWHPIGTYSWVRHAYGIEGSCGDDMGYGVFCMPCAVRRAVTESRIKGNVGGLAGSNRDEWHVSLFDCNGCDCCEVLICPWCVAHEIRSYLQPTAAPDACYDCFCLIPTAVYGQTRHNYGIITDCGPMEDLCIPLICFPCSMIRARAECRWQMNHLNPAAAVQMGHAVAAQAMSGGPFGGGRQHPHGGPPGQQQQYQQQQGYQQGYQQGHPHGGPPGQQQAPGQQKKKGGILGGLF